MSRTERQLGELLEQLDEHPEGSGRQGGGEPDGRTPVRESPQP